MRQGDSTTSYYQFYQSHLQNLQPMPSSQDSSQSTEVSASAPPIPSAYSFSDYSGYSSAYSPYPQNPVPIPSPLSSFSHLRSQQAHFDPYNQNQTPLDHPSLNPTHHSAFDGYRANPSLRNYGGPFEMDVKVDRWGGCSENVVGDGVYAYDGGCRAVDESSNRTLFDDYGRPMSIPSGGNQINSGPSGTTVIEKPNTEVQRDVKDGTQKFRVKLLAEGGGQSSMDVLCQIGLDGIRMLDPATSRTLRVYPLETVTSWEVLDSSTFAFWAKSSVDIEFRRVRLQSNSYTANTILDMVTAASVQLKEMGGRDETSESLKVSEQSADKKKGFADWMNLIKPSNEEKDHWVPDEEVSKCMACGTEFGAFLRKHHCRNCGDIFCDKCTLGRIALTADEQAHSVRVCDQCMAEVTQRLSHSREPIVKIAGLPSHEDLAKKLQEVMDKNHKTSSGLKADGSGVPMREVACPTCTVHLQVQVPTSGTKTIECSVCRNPFLVSAH